MANLSARKALFKPRKAGLDYEPRKEQLMTKTAYCNAMANEAAVKFHELTGRVPHNSIYKSEVPPDVEDKESLSNAYNRLAHWRK